MNLSIRPARRARSFDAWARARQPVAIGLVWLLAAAAVPAETPAATGTAWLDLRVNGRLEPRPVRVERLSDGGLVLPAARLDAIGVRDDLLPRVDTPSGPGYRLMPPLQAHIDESTQTLFLTIPPTAFRGVTITHSSADAPAITEQVNGFYFDYDLLGEAIGDESDGRGFFETIAFGKRGVFGNSFIASDADGAGTTTRRIETWWTNENPDTMTSLRIGDAISRSVPWGNSLRFAGLQWRRDFGTRPGFDTHPTPIFTGTTALPSVVDVYVDNIRREQLEVPAGPFELRNLPLPAADGTVNLVVTDVLGRQQTITTAYAGSPDLLRPGLSDFALQLGHRREAFGIESDAYGDVLFTGNFRRGLTDAWTFGAAVEIDSSVRGAGIGTDFHLGGYGTLGLDMATSDSDMGRGRFKGLRYRQRIGGWTFGGSGEHRSRAFRAIAEEIESPRHRDQWRAFGGVDLGRFGGLSASLLERRGFRSGDLRQAALSHRLVLARGFAVSSVISRTRGNSDESFIGLTLQWTPGVRIHASVDTLRRSAGPSRHELTIAGRTEDDSTPTRYRASAIHEVDDRLDLQADHHGRHARVAGRIVARKDRSAGRLGLQGSAGIIDGVPFLGRSVGSGGIALVRAGDATDVGVLLENRAVAHTDDSGNTVVTGLRPYERNRIALRNGDIPLTIAPVALETTAIPPRRRAVLVEFGLHRAVPVSATLLGADGQPLPVGTLLGVPDTGADFPVGRDGRVFVDLKTIGGNQLVTADTGTTCRYALPAAESVEPFTHLGVMSCERP